ncbi:hypothetical protein H2248_002177 [Termitomyces sp. 'cryptogamus']|nr:hypothetical protein H2248_002177 [Termitomyces sp. 'cryptogamus']
MIACRDVATLLGFKLSPSSTSTATLDSVRRGTALQTIPNHSARSPVIIESVRTTTEGGVGGMLGPHLNDGRKAGRGSSPVSAMYPRGYIVRSSAGICDGG